RRRRRGRWPSATRSIGCRVGCVWSRLSFSAPRRSRAFRSCCTERVNTVLFTCAGQRVDIVGAFADAGAKTVATDANALAPALFRAAVGLLVPRIVNPGYAPALRELVDEHDVDLIVPLTDLDQVVLA